MKRYDYKNGGLQMTFRKLRDALRTGLAGIVLATGCIYEPADPPLPPPCKEEEGCIGYILNEKGDKLELLLQKKRKHRLPEECEVPWGPLPDFMRFYGAIDLADRKENMLCGLANGINKPYVYDDDEDGWTPLDYAGHAEKEERRLREEEKIRNVRLKYAIRRDIELKLWLFDVNRMYRNAIYYAEGDEKRRLCKKSSQLLIDTTVADKEALRHGRYMLAKGCDAMPDKHMGDVRGE